MIKGSLFLAAMMATSYVIGTVTGVEAQQRGQMPQQSQAGNPLRQQRITQLRTEAERAHQEHQRQLQRVKKLERFEKPAEYIKKGADLGVGIVGDKVGPIGMGLDSMYQGVTKSILDPQGAERRNRLAEESRARHEEERLKKQKWEEEFRKRQEEFNRTLRIPRFEEIRLY